MCLVSLIIPKKGTKKEKFIPMPNYALYKGSMVVQVEAAAPHIHSDIGVQQTGNVCVWSW
jgi:hypothetical protein